MRQLASQKGSLAIAFSVRSEFGDSENKWAQTDGVKKEPRSPVAFIAFRVLALKVATGMKMRTVRGLATRTKMLTEMLLEVQ